MRIAYNLTIEDWVNFQEYYLKKKAPISRFMTPILTILLVCNIIIGIYMEFILKAGSYNYIFFICILILAYLLYLKIKTRKKLLKSGEELRRRNPGAFDSMNMNFTENGIDIQSQTSSKSLQWKEVDKQESNKDYLFIYSKKGMVYIIPKRDLNGNEKELEAILAEYLSKNI